ncbi:endoplasmic reticulum calcium ion homeostasis protein [Malassezia pachydermatis]|uniref:DUF1682-domain-containing protein n=1 Tax=Malassezia pachydermatis TaxID=77020 RepID=A0A0M8MH95_9BASI|nr:hypothetical protein Malapachy_0310 [Malassezia pachydermatis]KOS12416.1 hypothetical protein Malapachy_0310 [Malassezia pachydermatis]
MERFLQRVSQVWRPAMELNKDKGPALWTGKIGNIDLAFHPKLFRIQGIVLGVVVVYIVFATLGHLLNKQRMAAWSKVYGEYLRKEFAQVGIDATSAEPKLMWNGSDEACLFATGRRGVDTLHATVSLRPWQDPLRILVSMLYDMLMLPARPWLASDNVTLTFTLPKAPRVNGGVFALISKYKLREVRYDRYDMLFARVADAANASASRDLDERFAIASESGNITDRWLGEVGQRGDDQRRALGITEALNGPAGLFLESLVFTDQPHVRPLYPHLDQERVERLELTMRLPRTQRQAETSLELLKLALDLVDALYLTSSGRSTILALRPETHTALKKTRADAQAALEEVLTRDRKAELEEAAEEERLRLQKEKFEKLTPAEQAKRKEVAKRRNQRKAQMTQMKRSRM